MVKPRRDFAPALSTSLRNGVMGGAYTASYATAFGEMASAVTGVASGAGPPSMPMEEVFTRRSAAREMSFRFSASSPQVLMVSESSEKSAASSWARATVRLAMVMDAMPAVLRACTMARAAPPAPNTRADFPCGVELAEFGEGA